MFKKLCLLFLSLLVVSCSTEPKQELNPTLAALPTKAYPTVTPRPGPSKRLVCASYFQQSGSPDFIQGTWNDEKSVTRSLQDCYEWMDTSILHKLNCAQPGATNIIVVLVDISRHSYDLPKDLNMKTEFVVKQKCSP